MKNDSILSKILPKPILGKNLGKFAGKEFLAEVYSDSIIENLLTGEKIRIKDALKPNEILEIQLLDYASYLNLIYEDNEIKVRYSINSLFANVDENSLIIHKLRLARYLRNFQMKYAFRELEIVEAMQYGNITSATEFRMICLRGRMLLRQRNFADSLIKFDAAFLLLESNNAHIDSEQLILERVNRLKPVFEDPNWDRIIVDYDPILLNYLYAFALYSSDNFDAEQIDHLLTEANILAEKFGSQVDQLSIL